MSLIATKSGESAKTFEARLVTLGVAVETGCNTATSIAYSANALILRQKETVSTTEYRGLTAAAAKFLEELDDDTTTSTTYYHEIGTTGEYAAVGITTGTVTDYVPSRADEGDSWTVVKTVKTYAAASADGWTTTAPSASASSTGLTISKECHKSRVWAVSGDAIYAVETTEVREITHLTKAEADKAVADNSKCAAGMGTYQHAWMTDGTNTVYAYCYVQTGTNTSASARYVDATNGYTVDVTTTTYGAEGTGWSAA